MTCYTQLQQFFQLHKNLKKLKNKAQASIDQDLAIRQCLLCSPRLDVITKHHPEEENLIVKVKKINACKSCRPILMQIIACGKMGHLPKEE